VFAGSRGQRAHADHDDVMAAQIGLDQNLTEVFQTAVIANRDQDASGTRVDVGKVDLGLVLQIELLQPLLFLLFAPQVDFLRQRKGYEENQRERDAVLRGRLLREQDAERDHRQNGRGQHQSDRNFTSADTRVYRSLILLIVAL